MRLIQRISQQTSATLALTRMFVLSTIYAESSFIFTTGWAHSAKAQESHTMASHATLRRRRAATQRRTATAGAPPWQNPVPTHVLNIDYFSGPGFLISDFESNRIIGNTQFEGAKTLMADSLAAVSGPVMSVHTYLNMCVSSNWGFVDEFDEKAYLAGQITRSRCRTAQL